ncbi:MAG: TauD/TfdA family dioxygenase [Novosphingobium sp.]|nr:TauD/TfdA family dioxygenase [Novosphingobium sp.]MCP5403332.1 TauD/TfdA family dioxygenase [Novosphingobium sp.]
MDAAVVADVNVEAIKPKVGAVVHVDKATFLDRAFVSRCLELIEKHTALVFPRLGLTDEEQLAFTDSLGERINFTDSVPGGDEATKDVYTITLDRAVNTDPEYVYGSMFWHMDGIVSDIPPPKFTLLSCHQPPDKGGQTEFANTYAAWEALPDEEKAELEGLRVVHNLVAGLRGILDPDEINPAKRKMNHEHPLVWTHESGRKSLLIGHHADYIVGMPKPQGRALLNRLLEWAGQPDFSCRHTWQKGDFAMWDNTGALHRALPYSEDSGRRMHRTTVAGYEAVA